jgi:hypothetical protein
MLGDFLAKLTDETTAVETILGTGDLALLAALREQASSEDIGFAACVTQTAQRFAARAADEEWVTLMGMLNRSQDPAATCLRRAFEYTFCAANAA